MPKAPAAAKPAATKPAAAKTTVARSSAAKADPNAGIDAHADARRVYAPAAGGHLQRVRNTLLTLREPPQVVLFEGGTEAERQGLARWWAARIHCQHPQAGAPCLACPACVQIGAGLHRDVLMYDGRISNKDDEENPGPVRAFTIANARELKSRIADATRSGNKRVVILSGIDISREIASNALLKTLEEPSPTTVFVLLTPQREQLLPTLVSRSWVLTLPWPGATQRDVGLDPWEQALAGFLRTGRDWWGMTGGKGSVDQTVARNVILHWQKALVRSYVPNDAPTVLEALFTHLAPLARQRTAAVLDSAQEALGYNVAPARVLDAAAVELYVLLRR